MKDLRLTEMQQFAMYLLSLDVEVTTADLARKWAHQKGRKPMYMGAANCVWALHLKGLVTILQDENQQSFTAI